MLRDIAPLFVLPLFASAVRAAAVGGAEANRHEMMTGYNTAPSGGFRVTGSSSVGGMPYGNYSYSAMSRYGTATTSSPVIPAVSSYNPPVAVPYTGRLATNSSVITTMRTNTTMTATTTSTMTMSTSSTAPTPTPVKEHPSGHLNNLFVAVKKPANDTQGSSLLSLNLNGTTLALVSSTSQYDCGMHATSLVIDYEWRKLYCADKSGNITSWGVAGDGSLVNIDLQTHNPAQDVGDMCLHSRNYSTRTTQLFVSGGYMPSMANCLTTMGGHFVGQCNDTVKGMFNPAPFAASSAVDPTQQYLFAINANDAVTVMSLGGADNEPKVVGTIELPFGAGHMAFDLWRGDFFVSNHNAFFFILGRRSNTLWQVKLDYTNWTSPGVPAGTLRGQEQVGEYSVWGDQIAVGKAVDIHFSPDKKYLSILSTVHGLSNSMLNRLDNSTINGSVNSTLWGLGNSTDWISTFAVDQNGNLNFQTKAPTRCTGSSQFSFNHEGNLVVVACKDKVNILNRDAGNGKFSNVFTTYNVNGSALMALWDEGARYVPGAAAMA